jgi:hypothetical protein
LLCDITFSGGGYDISVLLSDEDCKVVGLNVSSENPNIISIGANELTAFSKAESDCKKKNPSRSAGDEIPSSFRIEKHQQERSHDSRGEKSERIS